MVANSRIRGYYNRSKTILFRPFFRLDSLFQYLKKRQEAESRYLVNSKYGSTQETHEVINILMKIFWRGTLQDLPLQKIIVEKIFHGGGGGGSSSMFNFRKIVLKVSFWYMGLCKFFCLFFYKN